MTKTFYKESELTFKEKPKHGSFQDLTGQKFNRLTVLGFAGKRHWFCRCYCGNIKKVHSTSLKNEDTTSCGCFHRERMKEVKTKHGHKTNGEISSIYKTWQSMLARCENKNNQYFQDYGGRGITVCERWHKFENFLEDMGERPEGLTLDRKENNKGYYKENCRWATPKEQADNRRSNHLLTLNGKTQNVTQWANELGLIGRTIFSRIQAGWPAEKALTTPSRILNKRK